MKKCPNNCPVQLRPQAKFCSHCGSSLVIMPSDINTFSGKRMTELCFLKGISAWLKQQEFQIGLIPDSEQGKVDTTARVANWALDLFAGASFSGGHTLKGYVERIEPFVVTSDLVAARIPGLNWKDIKKTLLLNSLVVPVIIAKSSKSPKYIIGILEAYVEFGKQLKEISPSMGGATNIYITPLIVYLDNKKYNQDVPMLLTKGFITKNILKFGGGANIFIRAGFVNIPEQTITWAEPRGFSGWSIKLIDWRIQKLGTCVDKNGVLIPYLTQKDLQDILELATALSDDN